MSASDASRCARADFSACETPMEEGALVLVHACSADFFEASNGAGPTVEVWFRPDDGSGLSCVDVNVGHIRLTLEERVAADRCGTCFKVGRMAEGGCPEVIYKLSRTEWLPNLDTPAEAMANEERATGDFAAAAALLAEAAALFGAQPAQLVNAMDVMQSAALERLLALCGDHLCCC